LHLSLALGCPMSASVVVAGAALFGAAWGVSALQQRFSAKPAITPAES